MTNPRQTLRQIYTAAIDIDDRSERETFVTQQCAGDEQLRSEVFELLEASTTSTSPLNGALNMLDSVAEQYRDSLPDSVPGPSTELETGATVGNYEIVEQLGSGGMAVVFLAKQIEPIQRKVALKLLKPGMDSSELLARFRLEQDALAQMDHPSIATVFDAGLTDQGRPYFAMELVDGVAVDQYCDAKLLGLRERLALFQAVCRAVHHAHEKSFVHRDLKPSNLLVTEIDNAPIVKVIDFGITKAMEVPLEQTKFTDFAQLLGTPLYMSPEMVAFQPSCIDRRSDVYALGAVLCQLLTGTPPFDRETMRSAGFDGMRHLIRNITPKRPSLRGSAAPGLNLPLPSALDWIFLKSIEKSPADRYQTAAGLAEDVERFLSHQPTVAAPPSITGRLHKLVRRHPTTSFVLCLSILFACLGTWMYLDKIDSDQKRQRAEEQAIRLVEQRQQEISQQLRRQEEAADAAEAIALQQMIVALNDHDLSAMSAIELPRQSDGSLLGAATANDAQVNFRETLINLANPKPSKTFSHPAGVNDSCISQDKQQLITVANDGKVRQWDLKTGELVKTIGQHIVTAQAVAMSPDGTRAITGDREGFVKVWDLNTCEELSSYGPSEAGVESIAWSPNGKFVAVGHRYEDVRLLDSELNLLHVIPQDEPRYVQILFSDDSNQLIIPNNVPEIYVEAWDTDTFECTKRPLVVLRAKVEGMCWLSGDARRVLITNTELSDIHVANFYTGATRKIGSTRQRRCQGLASSPDGRYVVGGFDGGKVEIYEVLGDGDSSTLKLAAFLTAHSPDDGSLRDLEFIDNKHFVSTSQDGDVHLWNIDEILPFQITNIRNDKYPVNCRFNNTNGITWIDRKPESPEADVLYFDNGPQVASFGLPSGLVPTEPNRSTDTAFCQQKGLLAVSVDNEIHLINRSQEHTHIPYEAHQRDGHCAWLSWNQDGSALTANLDKRICVWTFGGDERNAQIEGNWEFRSRGKLLFNNQSGTLLIPDYNLSLEATVVREASFSGKTIREWIAHGVMAMNLDESNQILAMATTAGFKLLNLADNNVLLTSQSAPSTSDVRLSDNGRILIAAHQRSRFSVWHIPTGKRLGQLDASHFCGSLSGELNHVDTANFAVIEHRDGSYRLAHMRAPRSKTTTRLRDSSLVVQPNTPQ
ncbi:MAG: serine/threonine-protein kinase [Aureliella sp.]